MRNIALFGFWNKKWPKTLPPPPKIISINFLSGGGSVFRPFLSWFSKKSIFRMKTRICIFCSVTSLSPSIICARDGVFSIQNTPSDFERSSSELASEISHACPPRRCQSTPSLELPSKLLETLSRAPPNPLSSLSRPSRSFQK